MKTGSDRQLQVASLKPLENNIDWLKERTDGSAFKMINKTGSVCIVQHWGALTYQCCSGKAINIKYYERVSVFLSYLSGIQCKCSVLYCHLLPLWFDHIFPHYLINGTLFRKVTQHKMYIFIFSTNLVWNISHCKKNWMILYNKCTEVFM